MSLNKVEGFHDLFVDDDRLTVDGDDADLSCIGDLLAPTDDCVIVAIDQDWQFVSLIYDLKTYHAAAPRSVGWLR